MMKKNISSDDIFYYIPKTNNNTRNANTFDSKEIIFQSQAKKLSSLGITGSSTFDYLNDINQNKYKFPKLKDSFLTKNLRNKKVLKDIEKKNLFSKQIINPIHKLRLSNSCELFEKLAKTFMHDKNSLKEINNKDLIYENDNYNLYNNINNELEKDDTLTKFNNCFIKSSLSNDKKKFTSTIVQSDDKKYNYKNNVKGMSKYYINFLYNKIFPKFFIEHNIKYNVIDNKLNIYYAENERQFKENLIKRNDYFRKRGKPVKKMCINTVYIADKLRDVKRKIGFLKGITDYSFPCIILQKVKSENRLYELNHMKKMEYCLPYEEIEREAKAIDLMKAKSLSETLKMSKCNIKEQ
jgi:hypothetical protein